MYDGENGWAIPTADGILDEPRRDDLEASAMYELLERTILPRFYDRDENGVPQRWVGMVRHTLEDLGPKVQATRMVRDYAQQYYAPSVAGHHAADANNYAGAKALAAYRRKVESAWPGVAVTAVDTSGLTDIPVIGERLDLRATVRLGGLAVGDVSVEAMIGRVGEDEDLINPVSVPMEHTGSAPEGEVFSVNTDLPLSGPVGYTVRVLPNSSKLANKAEFGLVTLASH
jgi:starch phosphorylase